MTSSEGAPAAEKLVAYVETAEVIFFKNRRLKVGDRVGFQTRSTNPNSRSDARQYMLYGTITKVEIVESELQKEKPDLIRITIDGLKTPVLRPEERFGGHSVPGTYGPFGPSSIGHWLE